MVFFKKDKNSIQILNKKIYYKSLSKWGFWSSNIFRFFTYIILFDLAFVFLYPFVFMLITSLKSNEDLRNITVRWILSDYVWENYLGAFLALDYFRHMLNSMFVTTTATIGHILSCSFIAYGFARCKFPGRDILFAVAILTFVTPVQAIVAPLYLNFAQIGFLGTYLPLIVPTFFGFGLRGGLFIFIFRQFFKGLPYELEEAARIDGSSFIGIYTKIVLPTAKSSILVCSVLSLIWHWNDYFEPTLYLRKAALQLLPQRLPAMYEALNAVELKPGMHIPPFNEAIVMAGTFLTVLPLLIIYLVVQKQFIEGIEHTGQKG